MPGTGPWTTHSVRSVYQNDWIEVSHREVTAPTGAPGIYGVVHFKHLSLGVVPIDADGSTWLVGQHRYALDEWSWEIPEGGGRLDVPPVESARRELFEETGLTAATWRFLCELRTTNSVSDERGICYVATGLTSGVAEPDDTEQLEVRRLPLTDAVDMVLRGEIVDAMSMAALLQVKVLADAGELTW